MERLLTIYGRVCFRIMGTNMRDNCNPISIYVSIVDDRYIYNHRENKFMRACKREVKL